jgi:lipopolysaccharide transport system ATP-binding protein
MRDDAVIRVEGLGKKYVLSHRAERERYTALRDVIGRKVTGVTKSAAGFLRGTAKAASARTEDFWALKGVDFEVRRGEVLGIIGRNGAGKSTLLKILSRITEPSEGRIELRGRVASLLEVGTGFHPELTGRENIYLNGAILGMKRVETRRAFDEIVAFSGVANFLDTPVKRYSSGMYMRLAFAVAAHLDPEILVVDEVLAVGDAEFQKKCLGKMKSVAADRGRTVLFVSHNLAAVSALTERALLLSAGRVQKAGETKDVVTSYIETSSLADHNPAIPGRGKHTRILGVTLVNSSGRKVRAYVPGQAMRFWVEFETDGTPGLSIELIVLDENQHRVGISSLYQFHGECLPSTAGKYRYDLRLGGILLASGRYSLDVSTSVLNNRWDHYVPRALEFDVAFSNPEGRAWDLRSDFGYGSLALRSETAPRFVALSESRN